jgi:hypothetical protein
MPRRAMMRGMTHTAMTSASASKAVRRLTGLWILTDEGLHMRWALEMPEARVRQHPEAGEERPQAA